MYGNSPYSSLDEYLKQPCTCEDEGGRYATGPTERGALGGENHIGTKAVF
jgi:hypothetical protein